MIDTCFNCGQPGHFASSCPAVPAARNGQDKPVWCGTCDLRTRLVDHGGYLERCRNCHPLAWRPLPQTTHCGGCRTLIYTWDATPCGHEAHGVQANQLPHPRGAPRANGGAAVRLPPPFAEATAAALHPERKQTGD